MGYRQTDRYTDTHIDADTDRQTDRQTHAHTQMHTHTHTRARAIACTHAIKDGGVFGVHLLDVAQHVGVWPHGAGDVVSLHRHFGRLPGLKDHLCVGARV